MGRWERLEKRASNPHERGRAPFTTEARSGWVHGAGAVLPPWSGRPHLGLYPPLPGEPNQEENGNSQVRFLPPLSGQGATMDPCGRSPIAPALRRAFARAPTRVRARPNESPTSQ